VDQSEGSEVRSRVHVRQGAQQRRGRAEGERWARLSISGRSAYLAQRWPAGRIWAVARGRSGLDDGARWRRCSIEVDVERETYRMPCSATPARHLAVIITPAKRRVNTPWLRFSSFS